MIRFSLPAITLGAATTLIIAAILVLLRDVGVVKDSIIPLGMILIGVLFSFVAIPMHASIRKNVRYRISSSKFLPSFNINVQNPTDVIIVNALALLLFGIIFFVGDGVVYGTNLGDDIFSQKIGGVVTLLFLYLFVFFMITGILLQIMVAEAFWETEPRLLTTSYAFIIFFGIIFSIIFGISLILIYAYLARMITGFLFLSISQKRLNTLRDFFIPLFVVLIPLTAYLSGAQVA